MGNQYPSFETRPRHLPAHVVPQLVVVVPVEVEGLEELHAHLARVGVVGAGVDLVDEGHHDGVPGRHLPSGELEDMLQHPPPPVLLVDADGPVLVGVLRGEPAAQVLDVRQVGDHMLEQGPHGPVLPRRRHGVGDDAVAVACDGKAVLLLYEGQELFRGEQRGHEAIGLVLLGDRGDVVPLLQFADAGQIVRCRVAIDDHQQKSLTIFSLHLRPVLQIMLEFNSQLRTQRLLLMDV